jgi:inner membrane protein
MDSITQIILGSAVGKLAGGKKLGNKAALWGAIGGTIPDLDVLFGLIYDPVSYLMIHRGFSHSIFFAPLTAPIFALIPFVIHDKAKNAYKLWVSVFFWALFTHPFLDLFTGYGTQLLNPFSNYGFEINSLFIIDPIYTLILGSFLIRALFRVNTHRFISLIKKGLAYSSVYVFLTVGLKLYSHNFIHNQATQQGIQIESMMTIPGPLSSILWRGLIKSEAGFYETYFSVFDSRSDQLKFHFSPSQNPYPPRFNESRAVQTLRWFSKGYELVKTDLTSGNFKSYDLRFGTVKGWDGDYTGYVFEFYVFEDENGDITFEQRPGNFEITANDFKRLLLRSLSLEK